MTSLRPLSIGRRQTQTHPGDGAAVTECVKAMQRWSN